MPDARPELRRSGRILWALVGRILAERRRLLASVAIGAGALALLTTALFNSVGSQYDELLQDLPPALEALLGDAELGTPEGWVQVEVFSFMGPALVIGVAVSIAAGALAGAEESGRLVLITSNAVARSTVVSAVVVAVVIGACSVAAALMLGIIVGALLTSVSISAASVAAACFALVLLALSMGAVAIAVGATTGHRGSASAIAAGVAVGGYAVNAFFPLSERLEPFAQLSPWYYFSSNEPLVNGLDLTHAAVLVAVSTAVTLVGYRRFERRDLSG